MADPTRAPSRDALFGRVRADWDAHPDECESLWWFWAGKHGGYSDLTSQGGCDDCSVWFYNEGLLWVNWDHDDDEDEVHVCACCARKRGLTFTVDHRYGIASAVSVSATLR